MELDAEGFVEIVHQRKTTKTMEFLGITPEILYAALAYLLFLLMIIFTFTFLRVKAFAVDGSFSAVINSLLPALSAVSLDSGEDKKDNVDHDNVGKACKDSKTLVGSHGD